MPADETDPGAADSTAAAQVAVTLVFAADAGQQMLESSPSVSEVVGRLRGFVAAVGLPECEVDATLGSLTLSLWRPGLSAPVTVMRAAKVSNPRLGRLSGTVELLDRVEHGRIDVAAAAQELERLKNEPGRRRRYRLLALLTAVTGWVLFLNGFSWTTMLVALGASLLTTPVAPLVERLDLPDVFGTALIAVVIAAVPNLAAAAGVSLAVGPAVVGAMFVYLPGVAVVSSVIDGLNNAPLSAVARGVSALVTAGALAMGMLVGSSLGAGLGLKYSPPDITSVPVTVTVLGAALAMAGMAIGFDIPRRAVAPTLVMGTAGWLAVALLAQRGSGSGWAVYLLAAAVVGFIGATAATWQRTATSVYLGVAIMPLVPGFTLYQAMLALAGGRSGAASALGDVAILSMSIAVGVAIGVAIGSNLIRSQRAIAHRLPTSAIMASRSRRKYPKPPEERTTESPPAG